jgi:tetratricopeptide (TPR) repeat protein
MARAIYAQGLKNMHGIYVNYSLVGIAKSYMLEGDYTADNSLLQNILEKYRKNPYILFMAARNLYLGHLSIPEALMYLNEVLLLNPHFGAAKRLKKKILSLEAV